MKSDYMKSSHESLRFQRNAFLLLSCMLALAVGCESLLLFSKRERVIIVPPIIEKEFWVEGGQISPTYLEQFGYFLSQLLLGKSAHSASAQRVVLLRHTDPAFVGSLRQKLLEEEELLKKQNASYTFYPISILPDLPARKVHIEGDKIFYVNGKQISSDRESYTLSFNSKGSRLLLRGVEITKKEAGA